MSLPTPTWEPGAAAPQLRPVEPEADQLPLVERIERDLRELLAAETRAYDRLAADLAAVKTRRDRYQKALSAMLGEPAAAPKKKAPPKPAASGPGRPRQQHLDEIVKVLGEATEPLTSVAIIERVAASSETVGRGLRALRAEEVVRQVTPGSGSNGRGATYALMPGGPDAA